MAARGVKKRDYERLDDSSIARVILLLEAEKPTTKKAACEILNIAYNTARLSKIIEEYKEKLAYDKKRRAANKGKAFSDLETKDMVISYLSGDSIKDIADCNYRSVGVVKKHLESLHLPMRNKKADYFNPEIIPDEAISETFEIGEYVWSARYNCVAEIRNKVGVVYTLWVFGKHNEFAQQPWWELGKLDVLKQFDLRTDEFQTTEKPDFNYRID
jgi:hypothetical protein